MILPKMEGTLTDVFRHAKLEPMQISYIVREVLNGLKALKRYILSKHFDARTCRLHKCCRFQSWLHLCGLEVGKRPLRFARDHQVGRLWAIRKSAEVRILTCSFRWEEEGGGAE